MLQLYVSKSFRISEHTLKKKKKSLETTGQGAHCCPREAGNCKSAEPPSKALHQGAKHSQATTHVRTSNNTEGLRDEIENARYKLPLAELSHTGKLRATLDRFLVGSSSTLTFSLLYR